MQVEKAFKIFLLLYVFPALHFVFPSLFTSWLVSSPPKKACKLYQWVTNGSYLVLRLGYAPYLYGDTSSSYYIGIANTTVFSFLPRVSDFDYDTSCFLHL